MNWDFVSKCKQAKYVSLLKEILFSDKPFLQSLQSILFLFEIFFENKMKQALNLFCIESLAKCGAMLSIFHFLRSFNEFKISPPLV
jgi:hypothetical protein